MYEAKISALVSQGLLSHVKAVRVRLKRERQHHICNFGSSLQSQCRRAKERGQSSFSASYTKYLTHTHTRKVNLL